MQTKIKTQKEIAELPVGFVCQCVNSHDELVEAVKMAERARASRQLEKLDKNILQQAITNAEKEA